MGDDQRKLAWPHREWRRRLAGVFGAQSQIPDIVMMKLKTRIKRGQIFLAPSDHPAMDVNPYVVLRPRLLDEQLARDPATTTAKVKNTPIKICIDVWKDKRALGGQFEKGIVMAHQPAQLQRRKGRLCHAMVFEY